MAETGHLEADSDAEDALSVLTAALLTPAQFPTVLGDDYPEACAALGLEPHPEGYGLVFGQDGAGARWTVVVDDVSLVAVAIATWDCGMEYGLSPDERSMVAALPGWPLALAVAAPGLPDPHDPPPEPGAPEPLTPPDTSVWGPAQRRLGADDVARHWADWRAALSEDAAGTDSANPPPETAPPAEASAAAATGTARTTTGTARTSGPAAAEGPGAAAGAGAPVGRGAHAEPGTTAEAGTAAGPGSASEPGTTAGVGATVGPGTTEGPQADAGLGTATGAGTTSAPEATTGPGDAASGGSNVLGRVIEELRGYLVQPPPPGRVRSAFAPGGARALRADGPGWSLVARTDDMAFVLLDELPGKVVPLGRGPRLPGLLAALDTMAVRPA
ncbi:hypothetical protein C6N75_06855 [Streptomyces solincola]|uniref:Integral membrane protein n=1 Tax=Streptomyces solincola TaxID=2100817 RepID=A0A2S9PZT9_9ACTN|nr:hypothetical protein [Streptomyces solincola]PRH79940.1 hypothetical protein C6N75_06855 [Streptomyces solincola]